MKNRDVLLDSVPDLAVISFPLFLSGLPDNSRSTNKKDLRLPTSNYRKELFFLEPLDSFSEAQVDAPLSKGQTC